MTDILAEDRPQVPFADGHRPHQSRYSSQG